jgi:hypothetical protein
MQPHPHTCSIRVVPIDRYKIPTAPGGWLMAGACSCPVQVSESKIPVNYSPREKRISSPPGSPPDCLLPRELLVSGVRREYKKAISLSLSA